MKGVSSGPRMKGVALQFMVQFLGFSESLGLKGKGLRFRD